MVIWSSFTNKTTLAINAIKRTVANASSQFNLDKATLLSRKWTAGLKSKPVTNTVSQLSCQSTPSDVTAKKKAALIKPYGKSLLLQTSLFYYILKSDVGSFPQPLTIVF